MVKGPGKYVVEFTMVGVHGAGDVIEFTKDHVEKGLIDVERLLRIGAIREAKDDEAKNSVEYGKDSEVGTLFPPVVADPNAAPAAHLEVTQMAHPEERLRKLADDESTSDTPKPSASDTPKPFTRK